MKLGMSVKRAQYEIDCNEFAEWMAFNELEPFGEEVESIRSGIVAATVARAAGAKKVKIEDYMMIPKATKEPKEPMSQDAIFNAFKSLAK